MTTFIPGAACLLGTSVPPLPAAALPIQPEPGLLKRTILVVDDEKLIADSITEILNKNGYAATAVYGGQAAVDAARTMKPELVLTDVLMPRVNGIEAARRILEESDSARIVLFSGQAGTTELLRTALATGMEFKLLPKPVHPDVLLKTISGMLHS